jgi:Sulfate permease family
VTRAQEQLGGAAESPREELPRAPPRRPSAPRFLAPGARLPAGLAAPRRRRRRHRVEHRRPAGGRDAQIVGLSPQAGLVAAPGALIGYALLGTSRTLVVGATTSTAALSAAAIGPLAHGDSARFAVLSAALALVTAGVLAGSGLLGLGSVADFIRAGDGRPTAPGAAPSSPRSSPPGSCCSPARSSRRCSRTSRRRPPPGLGARTRRARHPPRTRRCSTPTPSRSSSGCSRTRARPTRGRGRSSSISPIAPSSASRRSTCSTSSPERSRPTRSIAAGGGVGAGARVMRRSGLAEHVAIAPTPDAATRTATAHHPRG